MLLANAALLTRKADFMLKTYVASNVPEGDIFQSERKVRSGRSGTEGSTLTPSGLRIEGVGVGVGVGVGDTDGVADVVGVADEVGVELVEGVGDDSGVCAEPTTQMFPPESNVAAVAISFDPLSNGKVHCTVPVESIACTKPSVLTTPVTVPMR